jgi:hypothetical protein
MPWRAARVLNGGASTGAIVAVLGHVAHVVQGAPDRAVKVVIVVRREAARVSGAGLLTVGAGGAGLVKK